VRALLGRPYVLLADEPTSALDRDSTLKLYELLTYINQKHQMTIIWASHNRELVKKFNGRIIHLEQGKLIYTGHSCFI
jgi:ABC-type methionine transport system ATPase subunit